MHAKHDERSIVLDENALSINSNEEHLLSIKDKWRRLMNVDRCEDNHKPLSKPNLSETHNEIRELKTFGWDRCL